MQQEYDIIRHYGTFWHVLFFSILGEQPKSIFWNKQLKKATFSTSTYQRSLEWNPLKAVDQVLEADLNLLLISIKNWMGPYQRTPFKKLLELLDTHVERGPFSGSC